MNGNPEDALLIKELSRDPELWEKLHQVRAQLTDEDRDIQWAGGKKGPKGVTQIPYPVYGPRIREITGLLATIGAVTPSYHWVKNGFPSYSPKAPLSPADAIRAATATVRSERFNEGSLADAVKAGLIDAILDSLITWYIQETGK